VALFTSKTQRDFEAVRERLAEAEAAIPPIEARLGAVSLECVLSGDYAPAEAITVELQTVRDRVATLRRALAVAEAAERQWLEEARHKELRARRHALVQHLSRLQKAAEAFEADAAKLRTSWGKMADAAASALALTSPADNPELTEGRLRNLCEFEFARVGRINTHLGPAPFMPGSDVAPLYPAPNELRPLSDQIRQLIAHCTLQFERALGLAAPAPPAPYDPPVTAKGPTPGTEKWYEAEHARQRRRAAAAIPAAQPLKLAAKAKAAVATIIEKVLAPEPQPEPEPQAEGAYRLRARVQQSCSGSRCRFGRYRNPEVGDAGDPDAAVWVNKHV